jgi:cob(I)alamin adenosyltransferase
MENKNIPDLSLNLSSVENEVKEIYAKLTTDNNGNIKLDQKDIDRLLSIIDELDQKIINLDNNEN